MNSLQAKAYDLRKNVLDMVMAGKCGHIGGDMSVMEILVAIYARMHIFPEFPDAPARDRFILSKGHCVEALYAVLADKDFLSLGELIETYAKFGSRYIGHPNNKLSGIEMNSGSLGHGLSLCVGMALAARMDGLSYRVFTVMGDGELAEGSIWEAVMAAAHYGLDNICAVIDRNHLQISGKTEDLMKQEDLHARFSSFGWHVIDVKNGNDIKQLNIALDEAERTKGRPTILVANTIKGYGSVVMENKAAWHHRVPTAEEYALIVADFATRRETVLYE